MSPTERDSRPADLDDPTPPLDASRKRGARAPLTATADRPRTRREVLTFRKRLERLALTFPRSYAAMLRHRESVDWDKQALLHLVRRGDTVLDVGAHTGYFTQLFASLVGHTGSVHAFEPVPTSCERLRAAVGERPNVRVTCAAVADRAGSAQVFFPPGDPAQASLAVQHEGSWSPHEPAASLTAEVLTIDDYVHAAELDAVTVIKIDVEGAELPALRGASVTLQRHQPILHLELSRCWTPAFGYGPDDLISHLAAAEYTTARWATPGLERVDPARLEEQLGRSGSRNALFVTARHRDRLTEMETLWAASNPSL
jgi:FkbM family methyltransferase